MKKAFDQTVRDLKRGVNKKVLKVPGIEQKVLDATSNEPWGPHGSILADIALATRNYHEYQMIMTIIWKRINDTGKNWRHVYKGLTVLEYLIANGSERVIDEIREHAYQISTLSDFQYIDSSGRDQGNNVRKKSLSLVALVNDKERIAEVRQKAAANRDKFHSASSGGMYRPGSNSSSGGYGDRYDDDRYGSRDGDRNGYGYGREREGGCRDDDRYGRYGDSHSRDGDRYGRDYEGYSRDGYRDDDSRGRSRTFDDHQSGSRSRSSEGHQGRSYDDEGQYSSRDSGAKADDVSQNGQVLELRNSENTGAPPSYEEAINEARSPVYSESCRNGEKAVAPAPRESSPTTSYSPTQANAAFSSMAVDGSGHGTTSKNHGDKVFDEFDPRRSVPAPTAVVTPANPVTLSSSNAEMDLLGSLSDSFALAVVPTTPAAATSETSANAENFGIASSASNNVNQPLEDPFGDGPFRAIHSSETVAPPQTSTSLETFQPKVNENIQSNKPGVPDFGFGDSFSVTTYSASGVFDAQPPANSLSASQASSNLSQEVDILADILPPSQSLVASQSSVTRSTGQAPATPFSAPSGYQQSFSSPSGQPSEQPFSVPTGHATLQTYSASAGEPTEQHARQSPQASGIYGSNNSHVVSLPTAGPTTAPRAQAGYSGQISGANFLPQVSAQVPSYMGNQSLAVPNAESPSYFMQQVGSTIQSPSPPHMAFQSPNGPPAQYYSGSFTPQQGIGSAAGSLVSQSAPSIPPLGRQSSGNVGSLLGQTGGSSLNVPQPSKDKFETKSTVWTDTLSRGLVDLNISGPKTNPLSDIGVDFEAINRKEKRMEKPSTAPVISTVNMGKAMGAGSGIGRAGAGAMRAPPNLMIGSGAGMSVTGNPAMGMGGYGGINPSMGMSMGMGMGMNMGMGMAQGAAMQPPSGFPSGANMSGAYNTLIGRGGYGPQQPPYGGYR